MASIRDTLTKLLANDKPEPGTPLANYVGQYPFQQGEAPLEAPPISPDDLIGTGIGKAALAGGAKLAPALLGHTVYHGSPHIFDKFMLEKIGTGEGAQAFGHGIYTAENPNTAVEYQKIVQGPESTAQQYLKMYKTPENAISALEGGITPNLTDTAKQHSLDAINILKSGKELKGNMYKVNIPDEHIPKMLDWDKPLSQQPMYDKLKEIIPYEQMLHGSKSIQDLFNSFPGGQVEAAKVLSANGIPGVKYLDRGSRDVGQGTYNFVTFDPSELTILERNQQLSELLKNK